MQRSGLMRTAYPVSYTEFASWQAHAAMAWLPAQQQRWRKALERILPRLNEIGLKLPPDVLLISTDGSESESTPHTRFNAVVLPQHADLGQFTDSELLAHELFHVMTRYSPELVDRLYALIGFEPINDLQWPVAWQERRVADQDAPRLNHAMRVNIHGEPALVVPVAWVRRTVTHAGQATVESQTDMGLVEVTPGVGNLPSSVRAVQGEPVWHAMADVAQYRLKLGGNTDYILHPEEVMADNFMFLISRRPVANTRLLRELESELRGASAMGHQVHAFTPCGVDRPPR